MKKRTSKEILAEALLELARREPADRITVKKIVEESGLSLQTFYNHFRDKDDLVLWIHRTEGDRALARLENRRISFHEMTLENARFYAENANYLRSSAEGGILNPYAEMSAMNAVRVLSAYICRRRGMQELPEQLAIFVRMYVYSCLCMFGEYALSGSSMTPEQLAAHLEEGMPERLKAYLLD